MAGSGHGEHAGMMRQHRCSQAHVARLHRVVTRAIECVREVPCDGQKA